MEILGTMAGMLTVATFNAAMGQPRYYVVNGAFSLLLIVLFLLNRLGFVYLASLSAVVLMGVGSFYLIDENLRATFVTMPIPILIASSLLVPWSGFVVAVMLIAAALLDIGSLSLLILLIVAIISYLFADSLERAYQESRYQALHDPLTNLPNRALFLDRLEQALGIAERDGTSR